MSNLPQNGAELKALLGAEQPVTRESKIITGAQTKAEMLSDPTDKQQSLSTKTQTKISELKINRADVDTTQVSFSDYLESTNGSSTFEEALEAYNNKQNYDRDLETELRNQLYESNRDRTLGEVVSDTALSTSKFAVTAGQMGLGMADLAGRAVGVDNMGDTLNKTMGGIFGKGKKLIPNDIIETIDSKMSTKMQAQQQIVKDRVAVVAEQNKKEIAELGEKATWWNKFDAQGKEFDEMLSALADNPTALSDVALSSALAFTVPAIVGKAAKSYAKKQGIENVDKIGELGAVAGIAGLEGFSQAYEEKQKVLDMPVEQLAKNSPKFREYAEEHGVDKAKQMIADNVYMSNLGLMSILSAVAAKRTGAAALEKDLFFGSNVLEAVAKEGLEETIQAGGGQVIANTTTQRLVNENQEAMEGLGQSVATGLAGAVVTSGTMSGAANIAESVGKKANQVAEKVVNAQVLNNTITEAVNTGNFENLTKLDTHTPEQKAEMLMSEEVLSKATTEQKLNILNYVDSILGSDEETKEPVTKAEIKKAELVNSAIEAKEQVNKELVEPILGNLDSITVDDEDKVIKILGSSSNSFTDEDLDNLSSVVSEDNKPIIDAVIESRKDIAAIELSRQEKNITEVHNDVINGGKGFLGLKDYQRKFEKAISSGSKEQATKSIEMLNNFASLQAQKLADIQFIYDMAQKGIGTLALNKLNEEYRAKYNLPENNSIHRGSGKFIDTVAMEVKALNSSYKAMGAIYQRATGQSPMVLPEVSSSFSVPSGSVKQEVSVTAKTTPTSVTKTDLITEKTNIEKTISDYQYQIDAINRSIARQKKPATKNQLNAIRNYESAISKLQPKLEKIVAQVEKESATQTVTDQLTEDTAQAFVPPEQTQPTAAPETTKKTKTKATPVEEQSKTATKKFTKNTDIASDEVSDIRRVLREQQDAPSKLLDILMKYNDESSYIHQLAKKLKGHSLIDSLSFDDAAELENRTDNAGGVYSPTKHSVKFKYSVFKEIFRGLTDRVPFTYVKANTDPNSEEALTAAPYLVLHELIHAVTVEAIANAWKTDGLYEELLDIQSSIKKWVKNNKEFLNKKENSVLAQRLSIILEKEEELVTYGLTDVDVINLMKQIPSTKSKNLYTQFVELIRSIIGISDKDASLFDDILSLTEKLMDSQNKNKNVASVEEAKPVASSEAATATKAVADETTELSIKEKAKKYIQDSLEEYKAKGRNSDTIIHLVYDKEGNLLKTYNKDLSDVGYLVFQRVDPKTKQPFKKRYLVRVEDNQIITTFKEPKIPLNKEKIKTYINESITKAEPVQEDTSEVKAPVEAPKKLTRQRIFELVSEGVIEPVNKVMRKLFSKQEVNKEGINNAIKEFSSRLGKSMKSSDEEKIKERINAFTKGIQDAIDYKVDETSKDKDYLEGVKVARNNIQYNATKASVTNRVFDNVISKFFKVVNKDTLFNRVPYIHIALLMDDKFDSLPSENKAMIKNFTTFRAKFNNTLRSIAKKPYNLNSVMGEGKNDFVHLFMNDNGTFDDAFVTAMSLAAHNWLTQSASSLVSLNEDQIIDLLGLPENTELDPKVLQVFSKLGTTRETVADDLGKAVLTVMGYQFNKGITEAEQTTMYHSVGLMVIATLQDSGYVETVDMDYRSFLESGLPAFIIEERLSIDESTKQNPEMFRQGLADVLNFKVDKSNKNPDYIEGTRTAYRKTVYLRPVTKKQPIPSKDDTESLRYYDGMQDDIHEAITLARNERLAEVEPILNKVFDVEDPRVDPVFTKLTQVPNKIKNNKRNKMSAKQHEAVTTMSQRPWVMSSVASVFQSLSPETQQKVAGYKTEEEIAKLHVSKREKAKTNNDSIMRTIGYFTDFYNAAAERDFYLPVFVAKNNRMFYSSNTINPQTNKIIRRLINLKSNAVKVDLSNKEHEQNFRVALMDAFDIKVNWKNLVEDYQNGNDALTKFLDLPEVKEAVQGILDGDLRDGTSGQQALLKVVERAGTGYHAVQGLIALAQKEQAKGKSFETDLLVEIDGVANGVAILMWQFAGSSRDSFKSAMNRAGIYEEGDVTSYTEYAGKGNSDSYQELTKYWDIALNELTEAVLNRSFNPFNPNSILVRKNRKGKPLKSDIDKVDESLKVISSLVSANGQQNPQAEYQIVTGMRMLVGPLVDETGVTNIGRKLAKPPTMTSSYSAGFDSIMENVLNFILDNVYETLQKHPLKDKDGNIIPANQKVLADLSTAINMLYGAGTVSFETDNSNGVSNLDWTIDSIGSDAKANFDLLLKNTFGTSLNGAMNKVYGRLLKNRTVANDVAKYAFLVFKAIYEDTVERYLEANNKTSLSLEDKDIIMNQLKDLWPVLNTQSSVNPEEGIFLFKEKTRKVYGRTGNKEKDKAKVQSFTVKQEYARPLNNNGKDGFKTASAVGKETVLEEPGVGTIALSTQSIDAHSMFNFQAKYAALNNHDAIGIPITMASFLGSEMNTSFQEVAMGNYNIEGKLSLVMEKYLDLADQYNVAQKVWNTFNSNSYENAVDLLARIKANYLESSSIRADFKPYAVSQYDLVGAAKINDNDVVSDEEAVKLPAQIIAEVINDSGSKPKDNAVEDYSNATTEVLNADNTVEIFNKLHSMGLVEDNTKHTEALRSLLQEVVNKVITPVTFVLGEVNKDTRGRFMETKRGLKIIEQAVGNTTYGMSAQEVYVHELIHAVVEYSLSSGSVAVKRVTAMFEAVKSLVDSGDITYEDFLPLDANGKTITNPTAEQIKDAKERLDYIFNNSDIKVRKVRDPDTGFLTTIKTNASLSEFVTIGVTNEAFKNTLNRQDVLMALKTKIKPERTQTKSNSWVIKQVDNFVNLILDMVQHMLDSLTDKVFGLSGKPMDEQLVVLVSQLAGATGKHQSKVMRMLDSITEHRTEATAKLKSWIAAPLVKVAQSNMVKGSRVKVIRTVGRLVTSINNSQAGQWTKALRQVRSRIKMTEDNFAQAIAQEMIGVTSNNRKWHVMLRVSNMMIDQLRKHTQTMVKNILNEQFATKLVAEQKKAITSVVMRTDLSVLLGLGYTHLQIQEFIKDSKLLDAEVDKLTTAFKSKYKSGEGRWMYRQATNLVNMMVNGESTAPNALKNAHQIAKRVGRAKAPQSINEVDAENELEVLISLMALRATDDASKAKVISIIDSEIANGKPADDNGFTYIMEFHKNYVEESIAVNFNGDKTQTRKGYVNEQFDPNYDIKYGDNSPETKLAYEKMGYKFTGYRVSSDVLQDNQTSAWIYINDSAKLATNSAGIVSFTGTSGRGVSLTDKLIMQGGTSNIGLDAYIETKEIEKMMRIHSNMLIGKDTPEPTSLIPTFDSNGNVVRYSYEMSLKNKRELLKIEESYDDLLAHMQAHIKDKANTEKINNLVVKTLKEEFDADFTKSPKEFTYVGPDSPNPKMKELWYTLPESMRLEFGKTFAGKKGFYVKTRNLRLIFGFRKFTIGELFKRQDAVGNVNKVMLGMAANHIHTLLNKPFVHNAEEMWQEIVRMAKDTIVVKTGATLVGNIVSNVAVLATEGVPFSDIIKYGLIAWKGATKYQKDRSKLDRMKSDLANKSGLTQVQVAKLKRDIALLENEMSTNPVNELIQAGIYQTIVEDVDMDDNPFSFKSKLERKVDPILDKIPDVIRDTGKILFMTHDTQLYKAMRNATQISDFVGRFILHEHNKNKLKLSKEASIDNIVETFVNYDLPTHRSIQYLNDMGFIMFSKFFMRIQKVILRQLSTRTANVVGLLTIQQLLGINIADIFDGSLFVNGIITGKFASPDDHLDTIIGLHLINNI